eukprot:g31462.t1
MAHIFMGHDTNISQAAPAKSKQVDFSLMDGGSQTSLLDEEEEEVRPDSDLPSPTSPLEEPSLGKASQIAPNSAPMASSPSSHMPLLRFSITAARQDTSLNEMWSIKRALQDFKLPSRASTSGGGSDSVDGSAISSPASSVRTVSGTPTTLAQASPSFVSSRLDNNIADSPPFSDRILDNNPSPRTSGASIEQEESQLLLQQHTAREGKESPTNRAAGPPAASGVALLRVRTSVGEFNPAALNLITTPTTHARETARQMQSDSLENAQKSLPVVRLDYNHTPTSIGRVAGDTQTSPSPANTGKSSPSRNTGPAGTVEQSGNKAFQDTGAAAGLAEGSTRLNASEEGGGSDARAISIKVPVPAAEMKIFQAPGSQRPSTESIGSLACLPSFQPRYSTEDTTAAAAAASSAGVRRTSLSFSGTGRDRAVSHDSEALHIANSDNELSGSGAIVPNHSPNRSPLTTPDTQKRTLRLSSTSPGPFAPSRLLSRSDSVESPESSASAFPSSASVPSPSHSFSSSSSSGTLAPSNSHSLRYVQASPIIPNRVLTSPSASPSQSHSMSQLAIPSSIISSSLPDLNLVDLNSSTDSNSNTQANNSPSPSKTIRKPALDRSSTAPLLPSPHPKRSRPKLPPPQPPSLPSTACSCPKVCIGQCLGRATPCRSVNTHSSLSSLPIMEETQGPCACPHVCSGSCLSPSSNNLRVSPRGSNSSSNSQVSKSSNSHSHSAVLSSPRRFFPLAASAPSPSRSISKKRSQSHSQTISQSPPPRRFFRRSRINSERSISATEDNPRVDTNSPSSSSSGNSRHSHTSLFHLPLTPLSSSGRFFRPRSASQAQSPETPRSKPQRISLTPDMNRRSSMSPPPAAVHSPPKTPPACLTTPKTPPPVVSPAPKTPLIPWIAGRRSSVNKSPRRALDTSTSPSPSPVTPLGKTPKSPSSPSKNSNRFFSSPLTRKKSLPPARAKSADNHPDKEQFYYHYDGSESKGPLVVEPLEPQRRFSVSLSQEYEPEKEAALEEESIRRSELLLTPMSHTRSVLNNVSNLAADLMRKDRRPSLTDVMVDSRTSSPAMHNRVLSPHHRAQLPIDPPLPRMRESEEHQPEPRLSYGHEDHEDQDKKDKMAVWDSYFESQDVTMDPEFVPLGSGEDQSDRWIEEDIAAMRERMMDKQKGKKA